MRRLAAILAFAAAALAAGAAAAQPNVSASFDCTRAAAAVERMICGDRRLAALDRAMSEVYRRAAARGRNRRLAARQRGWMTSGRNRCADAQCIAEEYRTRISELMLDEGPLFPELSSDGGDARLQIAPVGGGWHLFAVDATWTAEPPGPVNSGRQAGVILIERGRGRFSSDPCRIDFVRRAAADWQLDDNGRCGGFNVLMTGRYRPARSGNRR